MDTKKLAKVGVILLAIPNALLTAVFFFILIGSLDYVFGGDWGYDITLGAAALLGIGFTIAETVGNVKADRAKKAGKNVSMWFSFILILIAATNWGAGMYRSKDNAREKGVEAKGKVTENPRYRELQKENDYLQAHVLNDGYVGNDQMAINRQREISAEMGMIEKEYVQSANILNSGGKWGILISLAFVIINLVYGLLVREAFSNEEEEIAARTITQERQVKRKPLPRQPEEEEPNPSPTSPISPATAKFGFQPPERDKKIMYKLSSEEGHEAARRKKELRKRMLRAYLEENPGASMSEMASAIGVSSPATIRKYLEEIDAHDGRTGEERFAAN